MPYGCLGTLGGRPQHDHAVTTTHLGIKPEQLEDPRYKEAWPLARATELLKITKFLPNNPQFGELNGIIYTAIQGVESGD